MTGVILAAGAGTRLNGPASDGPKCLVEVGGVSLLHRQIQALRHAGIDDITVVVGCGADRVRAACGRGVRYVENSRFAETNSLYSLWLATPVLAEGFIVLNCDVLFHPQLLNDLLTARTEDALLLSYWDDNAPLGDEEMKVRLWRGRVVEIDKAIQPAAADGENVGIAKFGAAGARLLIEIMEALVAADGMRQWAPRAFQEFARRRPLHAIGTRGFPWIEIDFPSDYLRAVTEVLPAIEGDVASPWSPVAEHRRPPAMRSTANDYRPATPDDEWIGHGDGDRTA